MSPRRPCLEAGCHSFAEYRGRCRAHAANYERLRNKAGRDIYNTKRWKMTRRRKLNMDPICEQCNNELATDVHHKQGVKVVTWEIEALESLCHSCHSRVTRREQLDFRG